MLSRLHTVHTSYEQANEIKLLRIFIAIFGLDALKQTELRCNEKQNNNKKRKLWHLPKTVFHHKWWSGQRKWLSGKRL